MNIGRLFAAGLILGGAALLYLLLRQPSHSTCISVRTVRSCAIADTTMMTTIIVRLAAAANVRPSVAPIGLESATRISGRSRGARWRSTVSAGAAGLRPSISQIGRDVLA